MDAIDYQSCLYCPNSNDWIKLFNRKLVHSSELNIEEIDSGYILPPKLRLRTSTHRLYEGGVIDKNFNFVAGLRRNKTYSSSWTLYGSYDFSKNEVDEQYYDQEVVFGGVVVPHFGHSLIDSLSRLWYVVQPGADVKKLLVFVCLGDLDYIKSFLCFTDLLGIDRRRILVVDRIHNFKKIIVPEQAMHSFWFVNKLILDVYDLFVHNATKSLDAKYSTSAIKQLYLTRSQYKVNFMTCLGEGYFENFYSNLGYSIISPEKFPLIEQIYLVSHADKIVTTMGTMSHLVVFAKSNSSFTILNRAHDTLLPQVILLKLMHERSVVFSIVDVSMNFIYGGRNLSINLLGPSLCWKKYLTDNGLKFEYDQNFQKWLFDFYNYFETFYDHFSQSKYYEFIKNLTIEDIMTSISLIVKGCEFTPPINSGLSYDYQRLVAINSSLRNSLNNVKWFISKSLQYNCVAKFHLAKIGWTDVITDYSPLVFNTSLYQIEAFVLHLVSFDNNTFVPFLYKVYSKTIGWGDWVKSGAEVGTTGKGIPILSLCIDKDSLPVGVSVDYRVYDEKKVWSKWIQPGDCYDVIDDNKIFSIEFSVSIG